MSSKSYMEERERKREKLADAKLIVERSTNKETHTPACSPFGRLLAGEEHPPSLNLVEH
jgi:hypothetical protein